MSTGKTNVFANKRLTKTQLVFVVWGGGVEDPFEIICSDEKLFDASRSD